MGMLCQPELLWNTSLSWKKKKMSRYKTDGVGWSLVKKVFRNMTHPMPFWEIYSEHYQAVLTEPFPSLLNHSSLLY